MQPCAQFYADGQGGGRARMRRALGNLGGCTPPLGRLMCNAGAVQHYEAAAQSLTEYSGLAIQGGRIQRMGNCLGPQMSQWPRPSNKVSFPVPS